MTRARAIAPVRRRKSLRTSTASGGDQGVPNTTMSRASSWPSAAPRATHVQAPGRGNTSSGTSACRSSEPGARARPVTEPSACTVASSAQRTSACPPGGAAARTPTNGLPGSGVARKVSGSPTCSGATRVTTENEAVVAGPARQSAAPPVPAPTATVTVYVPSPSNWSSGPAAVIVPAAPARVTQYGAAAPGWVGRPSGTAATVRATRWSSFGSPDGWSR